MKVAYCFCTWGSKPSYKIEECKVLEYEKCSCGEYYVIQVANRGNAYVHRHPGDGKLAMYDTCHYFFDTYEEAVEGLITYLTKEIKKREKEIRSNQAKIESHKKLIEELSKK